MNKSSKSQNTNLSFKEFKLETMVIELRFPFNFLLWDRAGDIWSELEKRLPLRPFDLTTINPSAVKCEYANKFEFGVEQERIVLNSTGPNTTFNEFTEILRILFEVVTSKLNIEVFLRIGFRQIFSKDFKSVYEVAEKLLGLSFMNIPSKILENHKGDYIAPSLNLRLEDGVIGKLYAIRGQRRSFNLALPPILGIEPEKANRDYVQNVVSLDCDTYTMVETPFGQLNIVEWVKAANSDVLREGEYFFSK